MVEREAEECFLKAIEIARRQEAKVFELRATKSLARLWRQQGKSSEAYERLAEICSWFTEGFETKDLQEAKALSNDLAATLFLNGRNLATILPNSKNVKFLIRN